MFQKGENETISIVIMIIIVLVAGLIVSNFGMALVGQTSYEAASSSTHMVDPSSNQPLQLDGVDLTNGTAIVRYFNCETPGEVDSVF
ncbi:MAG: hypothetical protein GOV15_00190, partial [Candidatus Diapherotrites archaeon]|nr:hypothetical protein [Candidatus Diapherotrites archaeon]